MTEIENEIQRIGRELDELMRQHPETKDEIQQYAREAYARSAPRLIEMVDGTLNNRILTSVGDVVGVAPSDCERLLALDTLVQYGLGIDDVVKENDLIGSARARLERDIVRELGISLDELRAQCQGTASGD